MSHCIDVYTSKNKIKIKMTNIIDIPGTFLNTKDAHLHTPISAFCEVIDNAHDAKAKNIKIWVTHDTLTVSDDGRGMDPKKLEESHILNKRSDPGSKNGRYGEGLKAFILHFFDEADKPSITISSAGDEPHYIDFKFNPVTGPTVTTPSEIGRSRQIVWDNYKLADIGTVIQVPINGATFEKIINHFTAPSVFENLRFQFGQIYHAIDINITIDVNGKLFTVPKISPIAVPTQVFKEEYPGEGVTIMSCWVDDASIYDRILNTLGIKYNNPTPGKHNQTKTKELGGKFITRGGRVISRQEINKPGSGNEWMQKIAIQTRHVVDFTASVEMDSLFGVSVNKSSLDQTKMDKKIKAVIATHIAKAKKHFENIHKARCMAVAGPGATWDEQKGVAVAAVQPVSYDSGSETESDSDTESEPEYIPQPTNSRSDPILDSANESDSETDTETEPQEPVITFTMMTGDSEIIIKYGDQVLYNVPCQKSSRSHFKKILENTSKKENFRRYVEAIIEANKLVVD